MKCYLVRMIDDHQVVGIYVARDRNDLAYLIDEITDPNECEYALLPPGGFVWSDPVDATFPLVPEGSLDDEDPDDVPDPFAQIAPLIAMTEEWFDCITNGDGLRWQPVCPRGKAWLGVIGFYTPEEAEMPMAEVMERRGLRVKGHDDAD